MKKKFFLGITAIILVVAAGMAGTMLAQGTGQDFGRGFRHNGGWMLKHIDERAEPDRGPADPDQEHHAGAKKQAAAFDATDAAKPADGKRKHNGQL